MKQNSELVLELKDRAKAYLKHAEDNRVMHSSLPWEMSQSTWERLNEWDDSRQFQAWELTSGQVREITGTSSYMLFKLYEAGKLPGAYRDNTPHRWLHVPAELIDTIMKFGAEQIMNPELMEERTRKQWMKWYAEQLPATNGNQS